MLFHIPGRDLDLEASSRFAIPPNWQKPGIYQVWVGDQSYIGKSKNVYRRLKLDWSHTWFEAWHRARVLSLFDEISSRDLNNAEAYWIDLLRPQLNLAPVRFQ